MMLFRSFSFAASVILTLTHCSTNQDHGSASMPVFMPAIQLKPPASLSGTWNSSGNLWYGAELTLQTDGTFTFHDHSCYGQQFSQGYWLDKNNTVILNSFDSFKEPEASKESHPVEVVYQEETKRVPAKGQVRFADLLNTYIVKYNGNFSLPGPNDTVRIYLNNTRLQIRADTLTCMSSDKLSTGLKLQKTENN